MSKWKNKVGEKFLPFIPKLVHLVINGVATATTRYHVYPFYPKPGETFKAHSCERTMDGLYLCTGRRKAILEDIQRIYFKEIGFDSPCSFEDIWCEICGMKNFLADTKCTYYEFRRIE